MSYTFIKHLTQKGVRIFTAAQAKVRAQEIGIDPDTMKSRLFNLQKKGMIERLMRGLYSLSPEYLKGIPLHEYEIGLALASPSSIAYISAYNYHKLTDQIRSIEVTF